MYSIKIKNTDKVIKTDSAKIKNVLKNKSISLLIKPYKGGTRNEIHLTFKDSDGKYKSTTVRAYIAKILGYKLIVFKNMDEYDYSLENLINGRQSDIQIQYSKTQTGYTGVTINNKGNRKFRMEYTTPKGKKIFAYTEFDYESAIIYNMLKIKYENITDISLYKGILNELGTLTEQLEIYNKILYKYGEEMHEIVSKINQGVKKSNKKYVGVYKTKNGYIARIQKQYVEYKSEVFKSEEEAGKAYNQKALELYGEYAKLNKIE